MDANAKLPSGILKGNINQLGDFDECLSIDAPNEEFQGQYCLAYIQPSVSEKYKRLNQILKLVQAHNLFKSNFEDVSKVFEIKRKATDKHNFSTARSPCSTVLNTQLGSLCAIVLFPP